MSNKDTWLFATVAHGLSAVTCIWVAVSHLLRDRKLSFVTVCAIDRKSTRLNSSH